MLLSGIKQSLSQLFHKSFVACKTSYFRDLKNEHFEGETLGIMRKFQPYAGILQRTDGRLAHIAGNARADVSRTQRHMLHKFRRIYGKYQSPSRFPSSLIVQPHSKWQHIPYQVECIPPSSLRLFPECKKQHNDCISRHSANRHRYMLDSNDNQP
jgi:hypothetical protein